MRAEANLAAARARADECASGERNARAEAARFDAELRTTRATLTATENERDNALTASATARSAASAADEAKWAAERISADANTRAAVLSRELEGAKALVAESVRSREAGVEAARASSDQLAMYQGGYQTTKQKLDEAVREVERGNTLVREMQAELNAARGKYKGAKEAARAAEEAAAAQGRGTDRAARDADAARTALERERAEREAATAAADALRAQLREAREALESNAATIAWLNRELTNAALGGSGSGSGSGGGSGYPLGAALGVSALAHTLASGSPIPRASLTGVSNFSSPRSVALSFAATALPPTATTTTAATTVLASGIRAPSSSNAAIRVALSNGSAIGSAIVTPTLTPGVTPSRIITTTTTTTEGNSIGSDVRHLATAAEHAVTTSRPPTSANASLLSASAYAAQQRATVLSPSGGSPSNSKGSDESAMSLNPYLAGVTPLAVALSSKHAAAGGHNSAYFSQRA